MDLSNCKGFPSESHNKNLLPLQIIRISGLDPAFPQYYPAIGGAKAISDKDAVLVDIIHTDKGRYGTPFATGTVDFWPNGGDRIQPGCPDGIFVPLSDKGYDISIVRDAKLI